MGLRYKEVKRYVFNIVKQEKEGTRIPSRQWICKKLKVARATVDKAIAELIEEGYLTSAKGSGTFVGSKENMFKVRNWGVILPNITVDIYPDLVRGIEDFACKKNINVVICNTDNDSFKQEQYINRLINMDIEGCIFVPSIYTLHNEMSYKYLDEAGIPYVFCYRLIEGSDKPLVTTNNFQGAYLGTEHLIKQGCRHIAYISFIRYSTSIDRFFGYAAAMNDACVPIKSDFIIHEDYYKRNYDGDYRQRIRKLITQGSKPDGIFCFNDTTASVVYEVMREEGLNIGTDISVVGFDNSNLAERVFPALTSIDYRAKEIGEFAAMLLKDIIDGKSDYRNHIKVFNPCLITRKSCKEI